MSQRADAVKAAVRNPITWLRHELGGLSPYPVMVLAGLNFVDELDQAAFNLFGPDIVRDLGVSPATFGLALLPMILLGMFLPVGVGYLTDRFNRVRLAIAGGGLWFVFALATGLVPAFWMLVLVRMFSAIGKGFSGPTHTSLLSDYYPVAGRGMAFSIHTNSNPVGQFLGLIIGGFLASAIGWQRVFLLLPLAGLIILALMFRLRDPGRGAFERTEVAPELLADDEPVGFLASIAMLRNIKSWVRYAWVWLFLAAGLALSSVLPFYYEAVFGVDTAGRGLILGFMHLLSILGAVVGGILSQRWMAEGHHARAGHLVTWSIVVSAVAVALLAFAPTLSISVLIVLLTMPLRSMAAVPVTLILSATVPARIRGQGFGAIGFMFALGYVFLPVALAYGDAYSYRVSLLLAVVPMLIGAVLALSAAQMIGGDVERANKVGTAELEVRRRRAAGEPIDLLEIIDLDVAYGDVQVLFGCNLHVAEGEMVALLGTNGAGKSTLLRAMSGLMTPRSGAVLFDGEDITGLSAEETTSRGIIHVPGGRGVFPGLTVDRNLLLGTYLYRKDQSYSAEARERVLDLFPRLAERLNQTAGTLSGGEQQMLTLAQAFMARPRILAIDELSLGLAPKIVEELLTVVRRINESGVTVILVEQSVNIALTLADRAYFMEKGEVRFEGPSRELLERGDLVRSVFLAGAAASDEAAL